MIKGSTQEEDITIVDTYVPDIGSPQYIRQLLITLKGEIDNNTIMPGAFFNYYYYSNEFITKPGALTSHLQQWTNHPDRKPTRKHRP